MSRNLQATYIEVLHRLAWEPDLQPVYHDDHSLAAYIRLSMTADACWPTPASLPRDLDQPTIDKLAETGLIELRPLGTYGIPGQEESRRRRHEAAKKAGLASVESPAHHDLPNVARTNRSNDASNEPLDGPRTIRSNATSNHATATATADSTEEPSLRSGVPTPDSPLDLSVELRRGPRGALVDPDFEATI